MYLPIYVVSCTNLNLVNISKFEMWFLEIEMSITANNHQLNKWGLVTNYEINKTGEILLGGIS